MWFICLVVLVRLSLSVLVQVIDWKDSSQKCFDRGDVIPYSLTHLHYFMFSVFCCLSYSVIGCQ